MSEDLTHAGQYNIDAIEILQPGGLAIDIRDQVDLITIYEDIFSPFMSGNMVCIDAVDLPSLFLNSGADLLHLRLSTPTIDKAEWIDRYFHIYRLADRVEVNDRTQSYIYYFVSQESLVDSAINISKTFRKTGDAIVKSLMTDVLKTDRKIETVKSINNVIYTSNNWSPVKNISYVCDHSIAPDKTPSYLFFDARSGFQFKPVTDIANAKVSMAFNANDQITDVQTEGMNIGKSRKNIEKDYATVLSLSVKLHYDYEADRRNGLMSSRQFAFDLTTKKLIDTTFSLNDDTHTRLNTNRFYSPELVNASFRGDRSNVLLHNQRHTRLYDVPADVSDVAYKQKRISLLRQFQQHKLEINVFGRTDYTVGMTVDLDVNKMTKITRDMDRNNIRDPLVSGKFIVSAVCHRFSRDGKHMATLELMRDSIGSNK